MLVLDGGQFQLQLLQLGSVGLCLFCEIDLILIEALKAFGQGTDSCFADGDLTLDPGNLGLCSPDRLESFRDKTLTGDQLAPDSLLF